MNCARTILGTVALPGGVVLTAALTRGAVRMLTASSVPGANPAEAVTGLAAACAAVIAAWLTVCLVLALCAELPGRTGRAARSLRDRVTPLVVRRWAAIVLGASVGASVLPGTAVSAVRSADHAREDSTPSPGWVPEQVHSPTTLPSPGWRPQPRPTSTELPAPGFVPSSRVAGPTPAPGWVPRRPAVRQRTDPHLLTGHQRVGPGEHSIVVHRGDTLWSIAAAHLGPAATDVEIARAWPRWYSTNATTIGADPHLLLPGTRLTPPTSD